MIDDPAAYRWSGCARHCGQRDALLTAHPGYAALGVSPDHRGQAYRAILDEVLFDDALAEIRRCLQQQRAPGSNAFQAMVQAKTRRFADTRPAHRPRKAPPKAT